jgi:hypothetical protein
MCNDAPTPCCQQVHTDATGAFSFEGIAPGTYTIAAWPVTGPFVQGFAGPFTITGSELYTGEEVLLQASGPPPPEMSFADARYTVDGMPRLYYGDPIQLSVTGCPGASAEYLFQVNTITVSSGPMTEGPPGVYTVTIPAPYPAHGIGQVTVTIHCSGGDVVHKCPVWIDPSGTVRYSTGELAPGARVTLLRSDTPDGPFDVVPFGSDIMSPSNRVNPDTADADGSYAWDVVPGYYLVRAELGDNTATSPVLTIPPAVTDLTLDIGLPCLDPPGPVSSPRLTATKLLPPSGDENLSIKGEAIVPGNHDPVAEGARLLLTSSFDAVLLDVTIPPGAYDEGTKTGWKISASGSAWTYKGPGTTTQGIQKFAVKRRLSVPDAIKFAVKGKHASLTIIAPDVPVTARLFLDVPTGADGRCTVLRFPGPAATNPTCDLGGGPTLKCK